VKKDAHYYSILAFCRACGFTKESSHIIAFASQYVDDAKINLMYVVNPTEDIALETVDHRPALFNMATCHSYFKIKTFNYEAMVNNTCAFHFVPGCKGENFTKRLRCMEESPVIMDILHDVLAEENLFKLGIVLHAYADTFSHQGFSGMLSKVNDIKNYKAKSEVGIIDRTLHKIKEFTKDKYDGLFDFFLPAYGHGQALDFPDLPYLIWSYEYDYSDEFNGNFKKVVIDNRERYQRAFNRIKVHLENYLLKHPKYAEPEIKYSHFDLLMDTLIYEAPDKIREETWVRLLLDEGLFLENDLKTIIYDQNEWLKEAFANFNPRLFNTRKIDQVVLAGNFANTCWYRYYLAVKWYKQKFFEYCSKYQLNIPH